MSPLPRSTQQTFLPCDDRYPLSYSYPLQLRGCFSQFLGFPSSFPSNWPLGDCKTRPFAMSFNKPWDDTCKHFGPKFVNLSGVSSSPDKKSFNCPSPLVFGVGTIWSDPSLTFPSTMQLAWIRRHDRSWTSYSFFPDPPLPSPAPFPGDRKFFAS